MKNKNKIAFYGSCLFFVFFASLNFTNLFLRQNNSLFKSGEWRSLKAETEYPVMGAYAFLITRRALPLDAPDLGTWHGLNEIVTKNRFAASEARFRFFLKANSYLSFQYGRDDDGFRGFTYSANQLIKSKSFNGDNNGVFAEVREISFPLEIERWNEVRLEFKEQQTDLFVNGQFISGFPPVKADQAFGFKGPIAMGTLVDDFTVTQKNGSVWNEDFSNSRNKPLLFFMLAGAIGMIVIIANKLLKAEGRSFRVAGLALAFCIVSIVLNLGDKFYFAQFYVQAESPATALQMNAKAEMLTFNPRNQDRRFIVANLKQEYFKPEAADKFKILFLGSSQTWGSGARYSQDIISEKFKNLLNEKIPGNKYEVFNIAVPGEVTKDQFENFLELSRSYPQVAILNMSVNDNRDLRVFKEYLLRFIELSREKKFRLILIPEPFFDESGTLSRSSQELVTELGKDAGTKVIPMQGYLEEKANSGFLWWDVVHLSSYGQDLLARRLVEELGETIRSDIKAFESRRRAGPWRQN